LTLSIIKLDIGCGSRKQNDYVGVDVARTKSVDVVASATNLPFKDNSVNYIYSRRCLQHVPNEAEALREMYRVLTIGGEAKIIVASYRGWLYYQLKHLRRNKAYPAFHLYAFYSLRKKLRKAKFQIIEIYRVKTRKFGYDIVSESVKMGI